MKTTGKESAIKGIISDHIIFERVSRSIIDITNVFEPNKNKDEWIPDYHYKGVGNAFELLNISDNDNLCEMLGGLTIDDINDNKKMPVKELTESLYLKWLICIRESK